MPRQSDRRMTCHGNQFLRPTAQTITAFYPVLAKPFSFYKIILSPTFQSEDLRIPKNFASEFQEELSPYCCLTVPTGLTHRVKLIDKDDELCFGLGWQDFVNCFSIKYGYLLHFIYQGDSKFRVHVFDLTACEIHYEPHTGLSRGVYMEEIENEDVRSISLHSPSDPEEEMADSEPESFDSSDIDNNPPDVLPIWLWNCEKELEALSNAGLSLPANPFFVTSIQSYDLSGGSFLLIPISFAREHLTCQNRDLVTVKIDDGSTHELRCLRNTYRCSLKKGWPEFAREIHLKVGDVCVFELIDVRNHVFKLHVLKAN